MKLAYCLFKYFPYSGLSRDFLRILHESRRRGHDVQVFASQWEGPRPEGVPVTLLHNYRWMNHAQNSAFHRKLRRHVSDGRFDAVIGFNKMPGLDIYYGADYCYVGRAVPKYSMLYRATPRYHTLHAFERAVFSDSARTTILSLSESERSVYRQYYLTQDHRFQLLPPTLDRCRRLDGNPGPIRARMRARLGIADDEYLLFFIGSGFKTKGLDRAITATASLPEPLRSRVRLLVVGQDDPKPFARLARRLDVLERVEFLGGRSDIPELLSAGELMIHPAYNENTGTVLLEAITSGLPVLTTDVCGYADHIERAQAGYVLRSPYRQAALDDKLAEMLASPARSRWSSNGIAYGRNPALYTMPESAVDAIERWVRSKPPTARVGPEAPEHVYLREEFRATVQGGTGFESLMSITGDVFREMPSRRTLRFGRGEKTYFLKAHSGVGWREILKNIIYFRSPVLGARNEWHGIHHLQRLGIDTLTIAGYGVKGRNPARRRSFIVTDEITNSISLEDFCGKRMRGRAKTADEVVLKRWLIERVAEIARMMHASGANHRDFYLCHFLLKFEREQSAPAPDECRLFLIDMHRMQLRRRTPRRWIVKDIAGLYFSAMDVELNLSRCDLFRFARVYLDCSLREALRSDPGFWPSVRTRALSIYATEQRRAQRRSLQDAPA